MIIIVKKKQKTLKINDINKTVCFHVNPRKGHFPHISLATITTVQDTS